MADKTIHHVVIGSDTYEIVDEQGRATATTNTQDITQLKEEFSNIGLSVVEGKLNITYKEVSE